MRLQKDTTVVMKTISDDIILGKRIAVFPASNAAFVFMKASAFCCLPPKVCEDRKIRALEDESFRQLL